MERKSIVVQTGGDLTEMPGGDWPSGIDAFLQSLANYAAGRLLAADLTWVDRIPSAANYASLPASVPRDTIYSVVADENNKNADGVAQRSIYLLSGSLKIWIPASAIAQQLVLTQLNFKGASQAETDAYNIKAVSGVGLQLAQSWLATTAGELYNQANARVKADGDLVVQGKNKSLTFTDAGIVSNADINLATKKLLNVANLTDSTGAFIGGNNFSGKALVIVDFNSIGAGRGSSHEITSPDDYAPGPFAYTMMNVLAATFPSATFGKKNFSVSGRQTPTMISQSGQVDAMFDPATYDRQIVVCGEITNHIADGGASATDAYNSYVTYCKARKAKGFTVVATTVINRTTNFASGMSAAEFASRQAAVNTLLRANYLQFADALADIATLNLTLPDGTHPNDTGYVTMGNFIAGKVIPLVQNGFNPASIAYLQAGSTSATSGVTPVLLLRGQGANNSTSIIDEGTPVHTMTANNTAKISTTQFKFGTSSIYLDGGANTHVSTPSSSDFDFGMGDFTMEAFIYKTSNGTGFPGLFARGDNTQNQWVLCWPNAGARLEFYVSTVNGSSSSYTAQGLNTTTDTPLNQWVHIALVRYNGATKLYQNGVLIGTATTNTALETVPTGKPLRIGFLPAVGQAQDTGDRFVGYLHARITKSALYTAAFTPPDSFPVPTATVLQHTSGTSIQSGNGTATAFTIAHGLGMTPGFATVMAGSDAADQTNLKKVTVDATNITATYKVAPASGTNNLTLYWEARR